MNAYKSKQRTAHKKGLGFSNITMEPFQVLSTQSQIHVHVIHLQLGFPAQKALAFYISPTIRKWLSCLTHFRQGASKSAVFDCFKNAIYNLDS